MDGAVGHLMAAYSADAVQLASRMGYELDYTGESLLAVEEILEKYHRDLPKGWKRLFRRTPTEEQISQVSKMWGGYVGEVMRRELGGEWGMSSSFENAISLIINTTEIYPPAKVNKRILNGNEDNIYLFFRVMKQQIPNGG